MTYLPQRKQIRLVGYDYTAAGGYFITICAYQRQHLFGTIVEGTMQLSAIGLLVEQEWTATPIHRPYLRLDAFTIMPNHVHGVVFIEDPSALPNDRAQHAAPLPSGSLGAFVRAFKSAVSRRSKIELGFQQPIWQRNFHERIIRNADEYDKIAAYVISNPANWQSDSLN